MRCAKAKKTLSDYLDDNLSSQKRRQLEAHLRECSDCDAELARLRSLNAMLQEAGSVEASEEYWDNYWQRLSIKLSPVIKVRLNWVQNLPQIFSKPIPAVYVLLAVLLVGSTVFLSDSYLDNRKTKSPELAKTVEDSYEVVSAGRASEATAVAKSQQLFRESAEDKKNGTVTEQSEKFDLELDRIVKSQETAAQHELVTEELERSEKIMPENRSLLAQTDTQQRKRSSRSEVKIQTPAAPKDSRIPEENTREKDALLKTELKTRRTGIQRKENSNEQSEIGESVNPVGSSEPAGEIVRDTSRIVSADVPVTKAEMAPKKSVGLAEKLLDKHAPKLAVEPQRPSDTLASSTFRFAQRQALGERYKPYGLIIRILKVNPADAKLNNNISKEIDSDNVFLSELRKGNSKVNLEFVLSSKIVTFVGSKISLAFKSGTRDYNFQLNILPASDQSQENRLAYLKNYATPKPGETVMFDIPKEDFDENNLAVLVTRFKPQM